MKKKKIISYNKYLLILFGVILGILLATAFAGKATGQQGIMPSLIFELQGYTIHLHHWFLASVGLLILGVVYWKYKPVRKPIIFYVFIGFLIGLIIQGIIKYSDWYQIVYKS